MRLPCLLSFVVLLFLFSCKKEEKVFSDNEIAPYSGISSILVENYVNRLYIDLIGREPTNIEMSTEVTSLRNANLSQAVRITLVQKLMLSEEVVEGDGSFKEAYFRKLYDDQKARYLSGTSEGSLQEVYGLRRGNAVLDSLNGNMLGYELNMLEANKVMDVLDSRMDLQEDSIEIDEMCRRMMFNSVYDEINMNTFNFINASFDNSFFRFPTDAELNDCFDSIDSNQSGILFGQAINNKIEYLQVLTTSSEFNESMVRWAYRSLLSRDATTAEVYNFLPIFNNGNNTSAVQQYILITDEYAGFN